MKIIFLVTICAFLSRGVYGAAVDTQNPNDSSQLEEVKSSNITAAKVVSQEPNYSLQAVEEIDTKEALTTENPLKKVNNEPEPERESESVSPVNTPENSRDGIEAKDEESSVEADDGEVVEAAAAPPPVDVDTFMRPPPPVYVNYPPLPFWPQIYYGGSPVVPGSTYPFYINPYQPQIQQTQQQKVRPAPKQ